MRLIGLAAMAVMLAAGAAHAEVCKAQGAPSARAVELPTGDEKTDIGWGVSMSAAFSNEALADLTTRPAGCPRGGFVADGAHYELSGDADDDLPRLARRADGQGEAFALTLIMDLHGLKDGAFRFFYGLVGMKDGTARLQRVYDAIPDDTRLAEDIRLSLAGKLPTYVMAKGKQITIFILMPSVDTDPQIELKGKCDGPGAEDAGVVLSSRSFYAQGITHTALAAAAITVDRKTRPRKLLAAADRTPCARAAFRAAGKAYELRGGGEGPLVRYAVAQDAASPAGYLLRTPSLSAALDWRGMDDKARKAFRPDTHAYMLSTDGGEERANIFRFYDKVPDDARLARDMSAALGGGRPLFALILGTDKIAIMKPEDGPETPGSGDSSKVTQSKAPDGTVFLSADDGAAVHAATRFVCPEKITDYRRDILMIFDPAQGGRDVACRYLGETGWFTLYLTRVEPGMDAAEVYQTYELQAKMAAPPVLSVPPLPDIPGSPPFKAFWVDAEGNSQSLQIARYGDWYVKQRGTAQAAAPGMITAGAAIFRQANETLGGPKEAP